ncbi:MULTISPECIES: amidohydrolase [Rhodobacterales]|jgi:predicted amidohydrolase YtcJ|uniref:amidohydrolase n=1 Tax=Rhodobacterales TaxID=204455 RepID=UPI00237F818F|nr:amidohydrolase [Phaeobacter gallaeciensis]MDE4140021.1 amidohydrolase [Phaeobacter gallaeciensis]MDE4148369.1 amidohydrolase [Phaeobacter gallaeciensis]MDE4152687.1 amidohydrolase [Phaeobacter gallaeciensis]MDE4227979.1 amidohydrolase [Phaeobacter gallaeciensis]MDE4257152.1 amidohydrolase [Phaeobacter gallaeciensis]
MSKITVFKAKKIITQDLNNPVATHVAVQDGKILAVGDADCAQQWGSVERDDSLSGAVLMPGFVEGHAHMMAGAMWNYAYAGYHDRIDPDGRMWSGMTDIGEVIFGLTEYAGSLGEDAPLIGWGFDPIFLPTERLNRHHLDEISTTRPIAIIYSNFHLMCVNSKALELAGYSRETNAEGVLKGPDGSPTGELQEMAAMFPVMRRLGIDFRSLAQQAPSIQTYGEVAKRAGVTTIADLFSTMEDSDLDVMLEVTGAPDFPVRIVPAQGAMGATPEQIAARAKDLRARSTDKLRLGAVKLMTDGSIQGWTARVKWPGYVGGQPNGIWNTAPDQVYALCEVMQREGVQMHIHVNGDEASEVAIDAIEAALRRAPGQGHRHVLQHCQMMGRDQFERCAELGICTNIFANHIWYFGDQHAAATIGEDRATRMDACRTALDAGVHMTIHSDAPVTPLAPLFTAWCAVNRQTMSGRTLGAAQQITVEEALHAITLGAAYTLRLDDEIGSIETGKKADFAVLGEDPTAVDPMALKDVPVLGTVSGGQVHLL